jgi:hypothetical protein
MGTPDPALSSEVLPSRITVNHASFELMVDYSFLTIQLRLFDCRQTLNCGRELWKRCDHNASACKQSGIRHDADNLGRDFQAAAARPQSTVLRELLVDRVVEIVLMLFEFRAGRGAGEINDDNPVFETRQKRIDNDSLVCRGSNG